MALPEPASEAKFSALLGGIAGDVEALVRQELSLTVAAFREELEGVGARAARILWVAALSLVALQLVAVGLALAVSQLVRWPEWGAFLAVGAVLVSVATAVAITSRSES